MALLPPLINTFPEESTVAAQLFRLSSNEIAGDDQLLLDGLRTYKRTLENFGQADWYDDYCWWGIPCSYAFREDLAEFFAGDLGHFAAPIDPESYPVCLDADRLIEGAQLGEHDS